MASAEQQTKPTASVPIYDAASAADQQSHSCNDPSHHHHHHDDEYDEHLAALAAKNEMLMRRKAKKTQQNKDLTRSENIPGHQGDKNIDDLLNFINGPSTAAPSQSKKKANKKPSTNN